MAFAQLIKGLQVAYEVYEGVKKAEGVYKDLKPVIDQATEMFKVTTDRLYRSNVLFKDAEKERKQGTELGAYISKYETMLKQNVKKTDPELTKVRDKIIELSKGWGNVIVGYDNTTKQPIVDIKSAKKVEANIFNEWQRDLKQILDDNGYKNINDAMKKTDAELESKNKLLASLVDKQNRLRDKMTEYQKYQKAGNYSKAQEVLKQAEKDGLVNTGGNFTAANDSLDQQIKGLQGYLAQFVTIEQIPHLLQLNQEQAFGEKKTSIDKPTPTKTTINQPSQPSTQVSPQNSSQTQAAVTPANQGATATSGVVNSILESTNAINQTVSNVFQKMDEYFPKFLPVEPAKGDVSQKETIPSSDVSQNNQLQDIINEAFKDVTTKFEALTAAITRYFENALKEDATTKTGSTPPTGDDNNTQTGNAGTGGGNGTGTAGNAKDVWPDLKERAKQPMENMLNSVFSDALAGKMKSFGDYFKSFADSILQSFNNQIMSQFTKLMTSSIMSMFGFYAEGGPVAGSGPYIVGERGPEVFVPNTSGTIIPNHKLGGLADSGAAAPSVTVNVINNSGQQVSAKQESHFDGQRYVVDVWLDALARNVGGVRDVIYAGR